MQMISNIIVNMILISPLIYFLLLVREYSCGENLNKEQKKTGNLILYLFIINNHFIGEGSIMEYYLLIYCVLIIPFFIFIIHSFANEKSFKLELFGEKKIFNIKDTKFFILFLVVSALLISQLFINSKSDQLVIELNKENFESIKNSQAPLAELAYRSENPSSMISNLDILMNADIDNYEILTSGNWRKEIRISVEEKESINTYVLTYRRRNMDWKLDGLYHSQYQYKN